MKHVLITGATGFLGHDVVRSLLHKDPEVRLHCLIRARSDEDLARRRRSVVDGLPAAEAERVEAVRGDIEQPDLGLSPPTYGALAERLDRVVHVAATTNFDHPLEEARRINVGGTEQALRLCRLLRKKGRLGRLDYVGTAYVAGDRTDVAREDELARGQGFRNTYEQSKFEAETLVRQAMAELPIAIHRPSIIVGDSRTGKTKSYKTIYWPMKVLVRFYGMWRGVLPRLIRLPVRPDCPLDIVPVNYVADAIGRLFLQEEAVSRCFHLCAGPATRTAEDLVNLACDHFGVARLRYLDPESGTARRLGQALTPVLGRTSPRLLKNAQLMLAYATRNPRFDDTQARAAGLVAPPIERYFPLLLNFAYGTDFGRAPATGAEPAAEGSPKATPAPAR